MDTPHNTLNILCTTSKVFPEKYSPK